MATKLQKLMFTIDLIDRVTGPAGKIQKTIGSVADNARASFGKIAAGGAGLVASGMAIKGLVGPAQEFQNTIGTVKSLDVAEDALDTLTNKAIEFSIQYGESANDFVAASYDIQSAIGGLQGADLATFTNASAVLAKATKADTGTITNYMGTMYGIFEETANKMGKAAWVEQLAGRTATAVQMYKTTGDQMSAAFTSLGAKATSAGVDQAEQIAILGKLQATMSGSEAGTKYKAFMSGVASAQDKLNLKFTDNNGNMLGMVEILEKIKGKYGETISVAESAEIKKAFGSDEAVALIDLLMPKVSSLTDEISSLGDVEGMEKAGKMADSMVDPFARFEKGVHAVRIGLGQALLPTIIPVIEKTAELTKWMYNFTQEWPTLTKFIGRGALAIIALTGVMASFALIGGVTQLGVAGLGISLKVLSVTFSVLKPILVAARAALLWLNAAMWANPVILIVAGIVALIAAVAAVIYWWDDLKAAFLDSIWGKVVMGYIDRIIAGFKTIGKIWSWVAEKLGFGGDEKNTPLETPAAKAIPKRVEKAVASGGDEKNTPLETPAAKAIPKRVEKAVASGGDEKNTPLETPAAKAIPKKVEKAVASGGVPAQPKEEPLPVQKIAPVASRVPQAGPKSGGWEYDSATKKYYRPGEVPSDLKRLKKADVKGGGITKNIATEISNQRNERSISVGQIVTSRPINPQEISSMLYMGA
jgi:TP901 family phage tail tape measure protein